MKKKKGFKNLMMMLRRFKIKLQFIFYPSIMNGMTMNMIYMDCTIELFMVKIKAKDQILPQIIQKNNGMHGIIIDLLQMKILNQFI